VFPELPTGTWRLLPWSGRTTTTTSCRAQRFASLLPIAPRMAAWMAPASCGIMSRSLWCSGHSNRDTAATALRDLCHRSPTNNLLPPLGRGSMLECLVHRIP